MLNKLENVTCAPPPGTARVGEINWTSVTYTTSDAKASFGKESGDVAEVTHGEGTGVGVVGTGPGANSTLDQPAGSAGTTTVSKYSSHGPGVGIIVGVAVFVGVPVNVAVPVAVAVFVGVNVLVGVGDAVAVLVGVAQTPPSVMMLISHPPVIVPESVPKSSTTYSDHVPFGAVPTKVDRADEPVTGVGAGAGNGSPVPRLVALYVPVTKAAVVMEATASSSSVRVTFTASVPPPTSDIITAFCPPGPTSRISMSLGNVWFKLLSLTVTL